jgi:DNA-directed RNA polymerase specialized sigma24 family protein
MSSGGSVTAWIRQLQTGDDAALALLHRRYWPRLVGLARERLNRIPGQAADEEDVAQEAFWSFYHRLRAGSGFCLASRHDLLALLAHIIACKAINQFKHEHATLKRGGGRVQGGSALQVLAAADAASPGLPGTDRREPSPLETALLKECYQQYVGGLPASLREVAELFLAGFTHREIAGRIDCVERTVERKMALVFKKWQALAVVETEEP